MTKKINLEVPTDVFHKIKRSYKCDFRGKASKGNFKVKVDRLKIKGKEYLCHFDSGCYHRLDNTTVSGYLLTHIDEYHGDIIREYQDRSSNYGLLVNDGREDYVISGVVSISEDPSTIEFVTDKEKLIELQSRENNGYWRSKCQLGEIKHENGFSYCRFVEDTPWGEHKESYFAFGRLKEGFFERHFLGDSIEYVNNLINLNSG